LQTLADKKLIQKRAQLDAVDLLKPIADELGCSLAQLALAWCMKNPRVSTVITGATRVEQVRLRSLQTSTALLLYVLLGDDIMVI
jgi:aryl-alcohol dehydrogenase-like predicted oxidoreductase